MSGLARIVGTAGHIDHGKTALVRALTGIDTDRLPQERARGITIDLGFAHLEHDGARLGIVDVPGHERFVRNMLAGATGIDVALLVVAADDSVMPQTREHLAILELLDVPVGVIALTKVDRVEAGWAELVADEVRGLVAGTFLEGAAIVATSSVAGTGIDALRDALAAAARRAPSRADDRPFRLAVDRAFVRPGVGTVVTGTVWSGAIAVGDEVEVAPSGRRAVARAIQRHGAATERVERGERAAIHLAGIHHESIRRGDEIARPGALRPARRIAVEVAVLPGSPWPLRHRGRVRLHLGTQECLVQLRLLEGTRLEPGARGWGELLCREPLVAVGGQPFVLRSESPVLTIGGGHVVDPESAPLRRRHRASIAPRLERRRRGSADERVAEALRAAGMSDPDPIDLARGANVAPSEAAAALEGLLASGVAEHVATSASRRAVVHRAVLDESEERVAAALARLHEEDPIEDDVPRSAVAGRLPWLDPRLLDAVIARASAAKRLRTSDAGVALAAHRAKLSEPQRRLRTALLEAIRAGGFQPPAPTEVARAQGAAESAVKPIVDLCASRGELVHLGGGTIFLHRDHVAALADRLREAFDERPFTMSELREALGTSRKYAVPIGEHLDRVGLTRRRGETRVLLDAARESRP